MTPLGWQSARTRRRSFAPGRVNLIGEHTDYTGGLVLPMAVQLGVTVDVTVGGGRVRLRSDCEAGEVDLALAGAVDPSEAGVPGWGRYVAAVVAEVRPSDGVVGSVTSDLPVGAGLSSSAALVIAVALALGYEGTPIDMAAVVQRCERLAAGVPCGVMDPLACAGGVEGAALLIDCRSGVAVPVEIPPEVEVVAVHSGVRRSLATSSYATRLKECEEAEKLIGPLRDARAAEVETVRDPVLRRRARHVVTENLRVRAFVESLTAGDLPTAGAIMTAGHCSLRDDFEVSTPELDGLVARLAATPGVLGARMTGAGFGGCAVALCRPGALPGAMVLCPSAGARLVGEDDGEG